MLKDVKSNDVLIIMCDMKAITGGGVYSYIRSQYDVGKRNDRGNRVIQFCK